MPPMLWWTSVSTTTRKEFDPALGGKLLRFCGRTSTRAGVYPFLNHHPPPLAKDHRRRTRMWFTIIFPALNRHRFAARQVRFLPRTRPTGSLRHRCRSSHVDVGTGIFKTILTTCLGDADGFEDVVDVTAACRRSNATVSLSSRHARRRNHCRRSRRIIARGGGAAHRVSGTPDD